MPERAHRDTGEKCVLCMHVGPYHNPQAHIHTPPTTGQGIYVNLPVTVGGLREAAGLSCKLSASRCLCGLFLTSFWSDVQTHVEVCGMFTPSLFILKEEVIVVEGKVEGRNSIDA